ncbi:MAG: type I-E CRISPR-associated endonuclease Cas1e [Dehalococcoidia bacterium]
MRDLHTLPKVRDSWSYLYVEHCRIDQEDKAIALHDKAGVVSVPCATLTTLMLGPGTNISHAAIRTLAESGCLVLWTGEEGVRTYAQGMGETRSARNLLHQARLWSDPALRLQVVRQMYEIRFPDPLEPGLTLQQIRGKEGIRVRAAYARWSAESGVPWSGRSYQRSRWSASDPVNRALSAANSCLYGICHAAIVSAGFSPALGFIHTGKMLSFVYDIADLYKTEISVPIAFHAAAQGVSNPETFVRKACRDTFASGRILQRIIPEIERVLAIPTSSGTVPDFDSDEALPGGLWDPDRAAVAGGVNWGEDGAED